MPNDQIVTVFITTASGLFLALVGYLVTYTINLYMDRRKSKLDRINKQLSEFYGPLFAITTATDFAMIAYQKQHGWISYFDPDKTPDEAELASWRQWVVTVFMPNYQVLYDVITHRSDLIIESNIPECLIDLCAHISSLRTLVKRWEEKDYSEHNAVITYPDEVREYSRKSFVKLKSEQSKLLGDKE
jgi:hypothetical protein